jgi:pimeloyl-ACP methyl ester carboxylesterase
VRDAARADRTLKPDGGTLSLRLVKLPATGAAPKRGMLLLIPGGPGVGVGPTLGAGEKQFSEMRRYYDVVSFDPRGVGKSDPIRCDPDALPKPPEPSAQAPTRAEFQTIVAKTSAFFRTCFVLSPALMPYLSAAV